MQRWVPVSQRIPDFGVSILVTSITRYRNFILMIATQRPRKATSQRFFNISKFISGSYLVSLCGEGGMKRLNRGRPHGKKFAILFWILGHSSLFKDPG